MQDGSLLPLHSSFLFVIDPASCKLMTADVVYNLPGQSCMQDTFGSWRHSFRDVKPEEILPVGRMQTQVSTWSCSIAFQLNERFFSLKTFDASKTTCLSVLQSTRISPAIWQFTSAFGLSLQCLVCFYLYQQHHIYKHVCMQSLY